MITFRPAREADLSQIHEVYYENEILNSSTPPPIGGVPSELRHIFQTGTMYVAEQEESILAYAAAIMREQVTYLTDLFVRPDQQSSQIGKTLLHHVLPPGSEHISCTLSSTDPRAQALYIRWGMQPQWPHFNLRWHGPIRRHLPTTDIKIVEGQTNDPALVQWDAQIGGRERSADHAFWVEQQRGVPLWFQRRGVLVGYGYVRLGAGTFWFPNACTLGPIGARTPEDAATCTLAAVSWAQERADVLRIDVPGPHPCLALLLDAGFRIVYVETFVSTARTPFFDARCYIASGSISL